MIELAPDLMAALLAEADRQGKTVSEIASKAIKEWIDPDLVRHQRTHGTGAHEDVLRGVQPVD